MVTTLMSPEGETETFSLFQSPRIVGDAVVFRGAFSSGHSGLYRVDLTDESAPVETLVAAGANAPGQSGAMFLRFGAVGASMNGDLIVFEGFFDFPLSAGGQPSGLPGLYAWYNG